MKLKRSHQVQSKSNQTRTALESGPFKEKGRRQPGGKRQRRQERTDSDDPNPGQPVNTNEAATPVQTGTCRSRDELNKNSSRQRWVTPASSRREHAVSSCQITTVQVDFIERSEWRLTTLEIISSVLNSIEECIPVRCAVGAVRDVSRPIAGPSHPTVDVNRTRPSDAMDP
ncbi:hypothetical protein QJS10_CPA01g02783 [Acorus calamus]|uniref:Uncharacterized protein n=1 Tax=Acorus calamus TaxID=4465 RepID=A0AAV9FJ45_ACOCL|nr:hypothetical protein QJS10_CPA01g02783 [Acorus calamus]